MASWLIAGVIVVVLAGMWFLSRQLAAIHELVNSNLTKAQTDLSLADARIRRLEQHIADDESRSSS
jgi:hypothetical protein